MPGPNAPYSNFDTREVLDHCFDESEDKLRVTGDFSTSGLKDGLQVSAVIIHDTPTKIFPSPLANREGVSVRVWGSEIVYIGPSNVTVATGYPKFQYEEIASDIKEDATVELYGICEPTKSSEVRTFEAG